MTFAEVPWRCRSGSSRERCSYPEKNTCPGVLDADVVTDLDVDAMRGCACSSGSRFTTRRTVGTTRPVGGVVGHLIRAMTQRGDNPRGGWRANSGLVGSPGRC